MDKNEPILIACEESGIVTEQFINKGFTKVFSCDMLETTGKYPEHHIIGDVSHLLIKGNHKFTTSDGNYHELKQDFSLIIAFPPCTHLASSGARWFAEKRKDGRQLRAIQFFMIFAWRTDIPIAVENPIGIMSTFYRKPDQIIQPWQFGHGETKATCLWLNKLPKLEPTDIVEGRKNRIHKMPETKNRARLRSKTYPGIAKAMAAQWGK